MSIYFKASWGERNQSRTQITERQLAMLLLKYAGDDGYTEQGTIHAMQIQHEVLNKGERYHWDSKDGLRWFEVWAEQEEDEK